MVIYQAIAGHTALVIKTQLCKPVGTPAATCQGHDPQKRGNLAAPHQWNYQDGAAVVVMGDFPMHFLLSMGRRRHMQQTEG